MVLKLHLFCLANNRFSRVLILCLLVQLGLVSLAVFSPVSGRSVSPLGVGITENYQWPGSSTSIWGLRLSFYRISHRQLSGIDLGPLSYHRVEQDGRGIQLGLISLTGENYHGFQFGGIGVVGNNFTGLQSGAVVTTAGDYRGIQLAGGTAVDGSLSGIQSNYFSGMIGRNLQGLQLGLLGGKIAGDVAGIQLSGIVSLSDSYHRGLQMAGFYNQNLQQLSGLQLGLINRTKNLRGLQIGLINLTDNLYGLQLGLLNVNFKPERRGLRSGPFRATPLLNWEF